MEFNNFQVVGVVKYINHKNVADVLKGFAVINLIKPSGELNDNLLSLWVENFKYLDLKIGERYQFDGSIVPLKYDPAKPNKEIILKVNKAVLYENILKKEFEENQKPKQNTMLKIDLTEYEPCECIACVSNHEHGCECEECSTSEIEKIDDESYLIRRKNGGVAFGFYHNDDTDIEL